MMLKSKVLPLVSLAVILLSCQKIEQGPEVGKRAPFLGLSDLNGNVVSLKNLKGKVVIVNFWSHS